MRKSGVLEATVMRKGEFLLKTCVYCFAYLRLLLVGVRYLLSVYTCAKHQTMISVTSGR